MDSLDCLVIDPDFHISRPFVETAKLTQKTNATTSNASNNYYVPEKHSQEKHKGKKSRRKKLPSSQLSVPCNAALTPSETIATTLYSGDWNEIMPDFFYNLPSLDNLFAPDSGRDLLSEINEKSVFNYDVAELGRQDDSVVDVRNVLSDVRLTQSSSILSVNERELSTRNDLYEGGTKVNVFDVEDLFVDSPGQSIVTRSSKRSGSFGVTVSNLYQHMKDVAGVGDYKTIHPNGDQETQNKHPSSVTSLSSDHLLGSSVAAGQFEQHNVVGNALRSSDLKALGRVRGGSVIRGLLCGSMSLPCALGAVSQVGSRDEKRETSSATVQTRRDARPAVAAPSPSTMRSFLKRSVKGTQAGLNERLDPALDDHKYTLPTLQSPPSKLQRNLESEAVTTPVFERPGASILELLLRSTRRIDPNAGSDALLPSEATTTRDIRRTSNDAVAEEQTILHKLLTTTFLDSRRSRRGGRDDDDRDISTVCRADSSPVVLPFDDSMSLPIDSLLTDGFGLDSNLFLDDPQRSGIGLLGNDLLSETNEIGNYGDWVVDSEFMEVIQEEERQNELLDKYYRSFLNQ